MSPALVTPGAPWEPDWVQAHTPSEAARLSAEGRTALVRLPGQLDAALAAASVFRWHGATIFVTEHTDQVGLAVEMTDCLAGRRPPALTRRGLA
ncbi:hypothetical protein [Nonomuraea soli]|uniref:Dihydropteroate synthase n=1 Tax=Nonomuraea soli TaxID=1032476 RepID=A0A7W0CR39_9ACTN|nr:hypothetical protein [Nonomuraea soli]MBA2895798.1 dihydropteroate synthase [Nonomuraea soli]